MDEVHRSKKQRAARTLRWAALVLVIVLVAVEGASVILAKRETIINCSPGGACEGVQVTRPLDVGPGLAVLLLSIIVLLIFALLLSRGSDKDPGS